MSDAAELPAYFKLADPTGTAKLLGWTLDRADEDAGTVEVSFLATTDFTNPVGNVQGGILAAMLDDTLGPAVVVKSRGTVFAPTIQMNLHFLRPVTPGRIRAEARCIQLGKTIAYIEGTLFDAKGEVAVRATSTARVVRVEDLR